jgi:hypothetical protein
MFPVPTLAELQNPYASLNVFIDAEEELSKHEILARSQNPYVTIEIFGAYEPEQGVMGSDLTTSVQHQPDLPCIPPNRTASKSEFQAEARRILLQYEPLKGNRRVLRPEFRDFLKVNEKKSPTSRAAILTELERFDLTSMGALNPQLNREGDSLAKKLKKISDKYPS